MIEPGDVTLEAFKPDPNRHPITPEPSSRIYQGQPLVLGRYNEVQQVRVSQVFRTEIRMKGQRPLQIKFQERNLYGGGWSHIKTVDLPSGYIGFIVEFPVHSRNAGQHNLQYVVTNSQGSTILHQRLDVIERQVGG